VILILPCSWHNYSRKVMVLSSFCFCPNVSVVSLFAHYVVPITTQSNACIFCCIYYLCFSSSIILNSLLHLNICIQMTSKSVCDCMFDPVTVLTISNIIFVNIIWIVKCFRSICSIWFKKYSVCSVLFNKSSVCKGVSF
jgi:hypothetical protein